MFALRERGKALENMFIHDKELSFRINSMRNKLLGLWAAALMNKNDADFYANDVVAMSFDDKSGSVIFKKLRDDFDAAGVSVLDDTIHNRMRDLLTCCAEDLRRELDRSSQKT